MDEKKKRKRGRPSTENRKVRVVGREEVYDNYRVAARELDCNRGDVYLCLMEHRLSHRGMEFEFVDDDVEALVDEVDTI